MLKLSLIGNLIKDAENSEVGATNVTKFTVAVNNRRKKDEAPSFIGCSLWGKRGNGLLPYLRKGTKIYIDGELSIRLSGGKTYHDVNVSECELVGGRPAQSNNNYQAPNTSNQNDLDDEIPF